MIYQSFAVLYDQLFDEEQYQNWFEYDPLFYVEEKQKTLAQMTREEKKSN
ncbi:hypothetical protein OGM84_03025 [Pediococcus acidilactici]